MPIAMCLQYASLPDNQPSHYCNIYIYIIIPSRFAYRCPEFYTVKLRMRGVESISDTKIQSTFRD